MKNSRTEFPGSCEVPMKNIGILLSSQMVRERLAPKCIISGTAPAEGDPLGLRELLAGGESFGPHNDGEMKYWSDGVVE